MMMMMRMGRWPKPHCINNVNKINKLYALRRKYKSVVALTRTKPEIKGFVNKLHDLTKEEIRKKEADLKIFNFNDDITDELRKKIPEIIEDVYKRCGLFAAEGLKSILMKYQDNLGKFSFDRGIIEGIEYEIKLKPGAKPVCKKWRSLGPKIDKIINETTEELVHYGIAGEITSEWGFGLFPVYNNDGTIRVVVNLKPLNDMTQDDAYPKPSVGDKLSEFYGKTLFSVTDIMKAFMNVRVAENSRKYLTFVTGKGSFCYNFMPFGGKNCPAVWARASDKVFKNCKDLIKYVDDCILASRKENGKSEYENHLDALDDFFSRLVKYKMKIKLSKCQFFVRKVKFLGNIVTPYGRKPDDNYIKKLLQFRHPKNLPELRSYLGAIEWIAAHIFGLKKLIVPLKPLMKHKNKYEWTDECQIAFRKIQCMLEHTQMLFHPNFEKLFYIYCDASDRYYGGVLLQKSEKNEEKFVTIDMFSNLFTPNQSKLHITSKELISLTRSVTKWYKYLYGNRFIIHSDSLNLKYLFRRARRKNCNRRHFQWAMMLNEFDFDVCHIDGIKNKIADYLSRYIDIDKMSNLKEFNEGNVCLTEIKSSKRVHYMKIGNTDPFTKIFHANLYCLRKRHREKIEKDMRKNPYFRHMKNNIPETIPLNGIHMYYLMRKNQIYQMHPQLRRSSRLEAASRRGQRPDVVNADSNNADSNNNNNVGPPVDLEAADRVIGEIEDSKSSVPDDAEWINRNDYVDDPNEPILEINEFDLPDRIYVQQLRENMDINSEMVFSKESICNNQMEWVVTNIIIRYLNGVDHLDEHKTLSIKIKGDLNNDRYVVDDEILKYRRGDKLLIVLPPEHQKAMMKYVHTNLLNGGHGNAQAMEAELLKRFYWSGIQRDCREYITCCAVCKFGKNIPNRNIGTMSLFPPKSINDIVAIDHAGPLPIIGDAKYRYITTYYDRFSGYSHSIPTPSIDAFTTSVNFITHWVCRYGVPNKILTDLGSDFRGEIFKHLCNLLQTDHKFTTAYNPSTNGAVERYNRTLKATLRCIGKDRGLDLANGDHWHHYIAYANAIHNNRLSRRTKMTPSTIFLGRDMKTPIDFRLEEHVNFRRLEGRMYKGYIRNMMRINQMAANQQLVIYNEVRKQQYDRNRQESTYKMGQLVLYYKGRYPPIGDGLTIHWKGPYQIIGAFNDGKNYILQNIDDRSKIFNCNVKRISKFVPKKHYQYPEFADELDNNNVGPPLGVVRVGPVVEDSDDGDQDDDLYMDNLILANPYNEVDNQQSEMKINNVDDDILILPNAEVIDNNDDDDLLILPNADNIDNRNNLPPPFNQPDAVPPPLERDRKRKFSEIEANGDDVINVIRNQDLNDVEPVGKKRKIHMMLIMEIVDVIIGRKL